jgi:hypothetical protein
VAKTFNKYTQFLNLNIISIMRFFFGDKENKEIFLVLFSSNVIDGMQNIES